jgi:hypothetical protein
MGARKKKLNATSALSPADVSESGFRLLKAFHHQPAENGTFGFGRFYWPEGSGYRQSMLANFRKKRRPVDGKGEQDTAAKVEVLLAHDAPEEYSDVDFLVQRYEQKVPETEATAYAQVTLRFPDAFNSHHPYEVARAWARSFYVDGHGVPVVLVLHTPFRAGSDSPVHAHILVLLARLGRFSWGSRISDLASDRAQLEALASWTAFRDAQLKHGRSS